MTRKILYSPGHGAGWTTWESDPEVKRLMLDWPPLIAAIEAGETITEDHSAVLALLAKVRELGKNEPYLGCLPANDSSSKSIN